MQEDWVGSYGVTGDIYFDNLCFRRSGCRRKPAGTCRDNYFGNQSYPFSKKRAGALTCEDRLITQHL